ncbi:hypothetical protein MHU86_23491 [Fragilaria crotonensis]|nr:hypothetical protein MHU86_23491 [Fragilaria crotonensis]
MSGAINAINKTVSTRLLVTRKQKEDAKGRGDIRGWFGMPLTKPSRGRPKKSPPSPDEETDDNHEQEHAKKRSGAPSLNATHVAIKKQRGMYDQWRRDPDMFELLKAAVINACTANACADDLLLSTRVPRTTMRRHKAAFQEAAKQHSIPLSDVNK